MDNGEVSRLKFTMEEAIERSVVSSAENFAKLRHLLFSADKLTEAYSEGMREGWEAYEEAIS